MNIAAANLTKTAGTGLIASSDLVAGRLLTPIGRRLVQRSAEKAIVKAVAEKILLALRWGGTVASGWVTLLGIAIYFAGEALYYQFKDDAISEWLRGGPFSGDEDDQRPEWQDESKAYLALMKTMTTVSLKRLSGNELEDFFKANDDLSHWADFTESVMLFNTPAFAIATEAPDVTLNLKFQQWLHGDVSARDIKEGRPYAKDSYRHGGIGPVEIKLLPPQTMAFVLAKDNLAIRESRNRNERLVTKYAVEEMTLTYSIKVWDHHYESYEIQEVTQTLTDVDIKNNA